MPQVTVASGSQSRLLFWVCLAGSALLMFSGLRPGEDQTTLEPYFELLKLVTRSLTILMLLTALLVYAATAPEIAFRSALMYLPLGAFCIFALVSTGWSALKTETLGQAGSFCTLVLLSYATSLVARTPIDVGNVLRGQTTLVVLVCIFLLVTRILIPETGHMSRSGDGLGHATNSGSTAALGSLLLILTALLATWRWPWTLLVVGGPVLLTVVVVSANRLSMAITFVLVTLAACLYGNRYLSSLLLIAVGVLGSLFVCLDPDLQSIEGSVGYLRRDQSSEEIGSFSGRSAMWEMMSDSFMESPLLGHGYFVTSAKGESYMWYSWKNWTAHNVALQALVTTGIIGTTLLLIGLAVPVISFFRAKPTWGDVVRLKPLMAFVLIWYTAWGTLNESFLGPLQPESVILFTMFGVMVGASIGDRPHGDRSD